MIKVIVRACVHWSWLLGLCLGVGLVVGSVFSLVFAPGYQATSVIQLNVQSHVSQAQIIQPIVSYSALVVSDAVVLPVLKKYPRLDRQALLSNELVVIPYRESQSIQIQVTLPQAQTAANVANDLAYTLVEQQNAAIRLQYEKALRVVDQRIADEQKAINSLNKQYAVTPVYDTATLTQLTGMLEQKKGAQSSDLAIRRMLQMEKSLYGDPFAVIVSATPAAQPTSLSGLLPLSLVVPFCMFGLGIVLAILLELWVGRINSTCALQQRVKLPVLGVLRWAVPPLTLQELCRLSSPYTEDCRTMVADVLYQTEQNNARVIALAGLQPGAGTSSVAAQLAVLLAQSKRSVLLIDANFYHPSLHEWLKLSNSMGLATMLEEAYKMNINPTSSLVNCRPTAGDSMLMKSFITPTNIPNLYILPAGRSMINPVDLLSMPEVKPFLKWAAMPVNFVIIDCPTLNRAEAHLLGSLCDQTYIVVDESRDNIKQIKKMKERLAHTGVKVAGLVVTKSGRWI